VTGAPVFKTKFSQRTSWNVGDWSLSYNWRYLGGVQEEPGNNFLPAYSKIDAYSYVDLGAQWNVHKNVTLNFSVLNAANKKPPIVGGTIGSTSADSGNTFPQTYDAIGRYFLVGATIKF
jgi:outer membrane receptor protein involved in Fe transport